MTSPITLYYCPNSRATGVLALLEELHAPYELHVMNMKKGENREPAYIAVNPMGKVPAIRHDGAIITEVVPVADAARLFATVLPLPVKRRAAGQLPFLNDVVGVVAVVLGFLQGVGGADQLARVVVGARWRGVRLT